MNIDLHTHSTKHSACSIISPTDLVTAYINKGIDGVCITEHNILWDDREQSEFLSKFNNKIKIFFGLEIDTEIGHVLVFGSGLKRVDAPIRFNTLLKSIDRAKSALIWAHPFRWESMYPTKNLLNKEFIENFDAIELYNGNLTPEIQKKTIDKLSAFDVKKTGGSDAHSFEKCCRYATSFEDDISSIEELVYSLKYKNFKPVIL